MTIRTCKACGFILDTRPNLKDIDGVCLPCVKAKNKKAMDYQSRQEWLTDYIKENKTHNKYDCMVAVSGGKDSHMIVKRLVENHDVKNILLINLTDEFTHTEAGKFNLNNLSMKYNCDLMTFRFSPEEFRAEAKKGLVEELNPLKWLEIKLYEMPFEIARNFGIKLLFFGENSEFEYGSQEEPEIFHPASDEQLKIIYMGSIYPYSIKDSLDCAREGGFRDLDYYNEWQRQGQIENYSQIDSVGYAIGIWTKFPKFGFQRVSDIACRFVRDGLLTKEQAELLIKEKDYIIDPQAKRDFCRAVQITEEFFDECVDKHANKDLLVKDINGNWRRKDLI